jgi:hypothetical protein
MKTYARFSMRLTEKDKQLLDDLSAKFKEDITGVIRRAIQHYHQSEINPWNLQEKNT